MTLPSIIIGFVISTLYGALFHLWRGGGLSHLFIYVIIAWIGFWLGHLIGNAFEWSLFTLGPLQLGAATIGAIIFLGIGYWLFPPKQN